MRLMKLLTVSLTALLLPLVACGQAEQPERSTVETETQSGSEGASSDPVEDNRLAAVDEPEEPENVSQPKIVDGYEEIIWEDMMPEGEEERLLEMYAGLTMGYSGIAEGSAADKAVQIGTFNVVDDLDGKKIRLPGYTVPFEYGPDVQITEFLLVPYFGACLHAPPPPPNQTLYIKAETPIRMGDLSQAVWVYGTLHTETQTSELADTAYTLTLERIEEYTY